MRVAWIVLLAGCAFRSSGATSGDPTPDAPMPDASSPGTTPVNCWNLLDTVASFQASACPTALGDSINVMSSVSLDTDGGKSNPPGLTCATLSGGDNVCALAANAITLKQGVTLSAHGARPLVLLGHSITINGTIDVASRINGSLGGQRGPASGVLGCSPGVAATNSGGGGGGGFGGAGGKGGDEGGSPITTGGATGNAISLMALRGGCDGGRGGDSSATGGPPGVGGAGGGAVWIASDMGSLVIGPGAKINASGAGGARGIGSAAADDGGAGGGSGGLIVLQAPSIMLDPSAQIFANGGGGGGGAEAGKSGHDGSDPTGPSSGGAGRQGGSAAGAGGSGYSLLALGLNGADGDPNVHRGGGGGGGGAGAIRVASSTPINGSNVSPPPAQLMP